MSDFFLRAVGTLFLCGFCALSWGASSDALKRPMIIHRVDALGLEIWTEARPEWDVRTEMRNGSAAFTAETPALTVPPAGMGWVSNPAIAFTNAELREGAHGVIQQVAQNLGASEPTLLELHPAEYGDLDGFEASFSGNARGTPIDVRVFCGHHPGKPAVVMHAFTPQGSMPQISEHIRRSWTHVRYLR